MTPLARGWGGHALRRIRCAPIAGTAAGEQAGIDPCHLHAYKRMELIVTRDNLRFLPGEQLAKWNAACREDDDLRRNGNCR